MLFSQDSTLVTAIGQFYIVLLVDWEKPRWSSERNKYSNSIPAEPHCHLPCWWQAKNINFCGWVELTKGSSFNLDLQ